MKISCIVPRHRQSERLQDLLYRRQSWIETADADKYILEAHRDCVKVCFLTDAKLGSMTVDFLDKRLAYRRKFGGGRRQMIAKAVGVKKGVCPTVVDGTAGFGRDAFLLAALGCRVHMIERSPIIGLLLEDGLERAAHDPDIGPWVRDRLSMSVMDAGKGFGSLPFSPDVVYLDPMYPEKKKPALVKKEMRLLKLLVGDDRDAEQLLPEALRTAKARVVVKRPAHAGSLGQRKPNMSLKTVKNRFDLYLV